MFDNNRTVDLVESDVDGASTVSVIESILLNSGLPEIVKTAPITRVFERLIDSGEVTRLTQPNEHDCDNPVVVEKLRIRRKALTNHLGSRLTCLLIHLPGAFYTVEIDPSLMKVVHWEWHRQ